MRRALSILFCCAVTALAGTEVRVDTGSALPGATVSVNVQLNADTSISALQLEVGYDSTRLTLAEPAAGAALNGHVIETADPASNRKQILIYSTAVNSINNGALVKLSFTVKTNAPVGVLPLTLANVILSDPYGVRVPQVNLVPGAFTVLSLTPPSPPVLSNIVRAQNGEVRFELTGAEGRTYQIHATTDLKNWTPIRTNQVVGGAITITDLPVPPLPARYYRAALVP